MRHVLQGAPGPALTLVARTEPRAGARAAGSHSQRSCATAVPLQGVRTFFVWLLVGAKLLVSWLMAVVPFAFLMAEFIAIGAGADRGRDTLLAPSEVDANALAFLKYFLPFGIGAVLVLKIALACVKGPTQSRHVAKFNDFVNAFGFLMVYYVAVASVRAPGACHGLGWGVR